MLVIACAAIALIISISNMLLDHLYEKDLKDGLQSKRKDYGLMGTLKESRKLKKQMRREKK